MRGSFRGFRIDRERAIRIGAMIGLAALGISTLPDLLRTPEPPPVPANVGFSPGEMSRFEAQPDPASESRFRAGKARRKDARRERDARERRASELRRQEDRKRGAARKKRAEKARRGDKGSVPTESSDPGSAPDPDPVSTARGSAATSPAQTSPSPAYSPPAYVPPPAPQPVPLPPTSDGSQEFAPR